MVEMGNKQIFKVRDVGREHTIRVPNSVTGYYAMDFNEKTGEIRYKPVKA